MPSVALLDRLTNGTFLCYFLHKVLAMLDRIMHHMDMTLEMKTKVIVQNGFYEIRRGANLLGAGYSLGKSPAEIAQASGLDLSSVELVGESESKLHPLFANILAAHGIK